MASSSEQSSSENAPKPCRTCTDFKTWNKMKKKKEGSLPEDSPNQESDVETSQINSNCPLNRDDLGRNTWSFLHTMAAYYPENPTDQHKSEALQFFQLFPRFYPCQECADDLQHQIDRFPPKTGSQHELSQWLCRVHNRINLRLGKPLFDCSTVNERWKDGWKDGSCD